MHLGDYIRRKREELKISQEAVAFQLNMSQAAYSKIERNETKLKVEQVYAIADYFGLSVYELLPPSLASDITGENIFGLIWQYLKLLFRRIFSPSKKQT
ncbi:XRE family transcriptional regulator [Sphingobacterium gobiense]|uniref:XRE family transcriptional regulator n=1 Tax=Sphingobacterium gobiense TaxID=1382456 RepID=A0A2S9JVY9_9SPHI|nr:XRE family transcriptional regulator [Sphingobacterium gobiense]